MTARDGGQDGRSGRDQRTGNDTGAQSYGGGETGNRGQRRGSSGNTQRLAKGLGWFSIGLGLAEFAAPRQLARLIGIRDDEQTIGLLRGLGVREMTSGVGILRQPHPTKWMWSRVAGDAMDLTLLGVALEADSSKRNRVVGATAAVLGVAALDLLCSARLSRGARASITTRPEQYRAPGMQATAAQRSPAETYQGAPGQPRRSGPVERVVETGEVILSDADVPPGPSSVRPADAIVSADVDITPGAST